MDELQAELQGLQNLDPSELDDSQRTRLAELPGLIWQAEKTALAEELEKKDKDLASALSQKEHWRKKAEEPKPNQGGESSPIDPLDLIKVGKKLQDYSDEELDFVTRAAKSKKPEDILKTLEDPYIVAGIQAQREKVEKEKSLRPSGTQGTSEKPKSFLEKLAAASPKEKEELLKERGLYKDPSPNKGGGYMGTRQ